ncbi:hypothetical protein M422DRAFT_270363 [Sphaerobolus stellatus SS14]|uniref:Aminoglycoside phosphotransferase domain-containing protein n=1 Tax=Sphaerobolus stellatus (strain SS14) TaxID=990650 RepID=A0A0C9TG34_SPHS4|nr:hypothetical protein M422DRAFT_270363 [Sphaerobolus stellatus SS14]
MSHSFITVELSVLGSSVSFSCTTSSNGTRTPLFAKYDVVLAITPVRLCRGARRCMRRLCATFALSPLYVYRLDRRADTLSNTVGSTLPIGEANRVLLSKLQQVQLLEAAAILSYLPPINSGGGFYLTASSSCPQRASAHPEPFFRRYGNGNGWMDGSTSTSDDGSEPDTAVAVSGSVAAAAELSQYPSKHILRQRSSALCLGRHANPVPGPATSSRRSTPHEFQPQSTPRSCARKTSGSAPTTRQTLSVFLNYPNQVPLELCGPFRSDQEWMEAAVYLGIPGTRTTDIKNRYSFDKLVEVFDIAKQFEYPKSSLIGIETFHFSHGDLHTANILVDPATEAITGILDWEMAGFRPAWLAAVASEWSNDD